MHTDASMRMSWLCNDSAYIQYAYAVRSGKLLEINDTGMAKLRFCTNPPIDVGYVTLIVDSHLRNRNSFRIL